MKAFVQRLALLSLLAACSPGQRNESVQAANEGTKAYGAKQWETAIERYKKATERWKENHTAWYGLSASYAQRKEWGKAADAASQAVSLEPDTAMYHLMLGRTLYEKAIDQAREDQARKENKKKEEVEADLSGINFEKPTQHLQQAIKLMPELWRAHYLMGNIHRYAGRTKESAEAFSAALAFGPVEPAPWIAQSELYRAWDYTDQAIAVAQQGALVIPGDSEKSDVWFEVGMGFDDKRNDDKAIEAFDKALESKKDNHKAKFARGQAYYRKGSAQASESARLEAYGKAKRDLEEFSKAGGLSVEFFKQQASRMLMDMAAKSAGGAGGTPGARLSPADLVKKAEEEKKSNKK
ncbi:MAG: tetratricopeptide repeat protein [Deltaproteobacteria bacterium]|nr:tetratricopeptide repeat protein [Deltaproteobacteria bacterium]